MGAIYEADVWCDDCASKIKSRIASECRGTGTIIDHVDNDDLVELLDDIDEREYDSDEYPKHYDEDTEESDCPQHCADCGTFLENPLTTDGADYVREAVIEAIESGRDDSVALTEWFPYYDWIDWGTIGKCYNCDKWSVEMGPDECSDCANIPCEGDFTITPCGSLGGKSGLGRIEGKFVGEFDSDDAALERAKQIMQDEKFWPNIWFVSDHGNWFLYEGDDGYADNNT